MTRRSHWGGGSDGPNSRVSGRAGRRVMAKISCYLGPNVQTRGQSPKEQGGQDRSTGILGIWHRSDLSQTSALLSPSGASGLSLSAAEPQGHWGKPCIAPTSRICRF